MCTMVIAQRCSVSRAWRSSIGGQISLSLQSFVARCSMSMYFVGDDRVTRLADLYSLSQDQPVATGVIEVRRPFAGPTSRSLRPAPGRRPVALTPSLSVVPPHAHRLGTDISPLCHSPTKPLAQSRMQDTNASSESTVTLKRSASAPLPLSESSNDANKTHVKPLTPHAHRCTEPGCDRHFNRKYTLLEHMKTHTGEKPHVCPVRSCSKRFSTSGNLSRHKRLHGYIEPLECPVEGCLSSFPSNNKLEKHMKFHLGSAVHVCTINHCGKTFSTVGNLNRHIKNQHSDEVSLPLSEFSAPSPTSAEQQSMASYTTLLLESSMEVSQPPAIDVSSLPQFTPEQCETFRMPPPKAPTTWHSDEMVDVLTEIFDEAVAQPDEQPEDVENHGNISVLDDMINFHVSHMA